MSRGESVLRRPDSSSNSHSQNHHDRQAQPQQQQEELHEHSQTQQQTPLPPFSVISPLQQLQDFRSTTSSKTAAHHFLDLLQTNLYHNNNQDELHRLQACHANPRTQRLSNTNLCFAGVRAHQAALEALKQHNSTQQQVVRKMTNTTFMEQMTRMTVVQEDATLLKSFSTVYDMRRYGPDTTTTNNNNIRDKLIPNLGTPLACLPLLLAGLATAQTQQQQQPLLIAELGPYFGLSSKCLVSGLTVQPPHPSTSTPFYVAYDTFGGVDNLRSLQHQSSTRWILQDYFGDRPQLLKQPRELGDTTDTTNTNTSFLFLWERAVLPVYPQARSVVGRLDPDQNDPVQTNIYQLANTAASSSQQQPHTLSLVVIDSAKTASSWNQQFKAVLGSHPHLDCGSILFLMDFEFVDQQVKQVYGCLRPYVLPVYISWNQEHWAFVVTHPDGVDLTTMAHKECYARLAASVVVGKDSSTQWMEEQVAVDLLFVSSGLKRDTEEEAPGDSAAKSDTLQKWADVRKKLMDHMVQNLRNKPEQWATLAAL